MTINDGHLPYAFNFFSQALAWLCTAADGRCLAYIDAREGGSIRGLADSIFFLSSLLSGDGWAQKGFSVCLFGIIYSKPHSGAPDYNRKKGKGAGDYNHANTRPFPVGYALNTAGRERASGGK